MPSMENKVAERLSKDQPAAPELRGRDTNWDDYEQAQINKRRTSYAALPELDRLSTAIEDAAHWNRMYRELAWEQAREAVSVRPTTPTADDEQTVRQIANMIGGWKAGAISWEVMMEFITIALTRSRSDIRETILQHWAVCILHGLVEQSHRCRDYDGHDFGLSIGRIKDIVRESTCSETDLPEGVNLEERAIGYDAGIFEAIEKIEAKRDEWHLARIQAPNQTAAQKLTYRIAAANELIASLKE